MDAKLNPVSSQLPDFSSHSESVNREVDGPSFSKALKTAQTKEEAPEPRKVSSRNEIPTKTEKPILAPYREIKPQEQVQEAISPTEENDSPVALQSEEKIEKAPTIKNPKIKNLIVDDRKGVVAQSYDGMVVSYPVSKIAKESLDEKTLKLLDDQGLNDLPTYVMAQPSQKFNLMQKVAAENAVPVAKPIAQFMASLENELGVKPDRLVQAFKKLPPGQLTLPPEKTMAQVVKNLNLNPTDQIKASELFTKMLAQMEKAQNELMTPMMIPVAATGVAAVQTAEKAEENGVVTKNKTQTAVARYAQNSGEPTQNVFQTEKPSAVLKDPLAKDYSAKDEVVDPQGKEPSVKKAVEPTQNQESYSSKAAAIAVAPKEMTVTPQVLTEAQPQAQAQALTAPQTQAAMANPVVANEVKEEKTVSKTSKVDSKVDVKHVSTQSTNPTPLSTQVDTAPAKPGATGQPVEVAGGGAAGGNESQSRR